MNFNLENHVHISFDAISINEGFARMTVAAFMSDMNPTLEQICDVKTAVSEAVTNAIIHGYGAGWIGQDAESNGQSAENKSLQVEMVCTFYRNFLFPQECQNMLWYHQVPALQAPYRIFVKAHPE